MLGTLQTVLIALLTLGILVTIHEFGHFWVARRCGIRVLRFSVGFGPVLWRKTDRQQTEYTLCAIPLGGYVRMLDEREGEVAEEQLGEAFNRKSVWARIAVVSAGPCTLPTDSRARGRMKFRRSRQPLDVCTLDLDTVINEIIQRDMLPLTDLVTRRILM